MKGDDNSTAGAIPLEPVQPSAPATPAALKPCPFCGACLREVYATRHGVPYVSDWAHPYWVNESIGKASQCVLRGHTIPKSRSDWWNRRSSPPRDAVIEECAKAVEGMRPCPFGKGQPDPGLSPDDPCPVCGDLGSLILDKPSNCQSVSAIIRALKAAPVDADQSSLAPVVRLLETLLRVQKISAGKQGHVYGPADYADLCDDMDAIFGIARNAILRYPSAPVDAAEEQGFGAPATKEHPSPSLERVAVLEAKLAKAAEQFEFYAREHRAKARNAQFNGLMVNAESAISKAEINERFAAECRAALKDQADG